MKKDDAPQDQSTSLGGLKKPLYVVNEEGEYTTVLSSGWEAEETVLDQAIVQFELQCNEAHRRVSEGLSSPLEYHMYRQRMDVTVLAQSTGFFKWQVKRHLKPKIFLGLSTDKLARYEEALGLSVSELQKLPAEDNQQND